MSESIKQKQNVITVTGDRFSGKLWLYGYNWSVELSAKEVKQFAKMFKREAKLARKGDK